MTSIMPAPYPADPCRETGKAVDLLDVDAPILDRLDRAGDLMMRRAAFSGSA
jgi:hypothetical protein